MAPDILAHIDDQSWRVLEPEQGGVELVDHRLCGEAADDDAAVAAEAASLSKVVLAVAVHDMVRDGLVDLDQPVTKHVAFTNDAATRSITPRRLLSDSSGLPNWRDEAGEPLTALFAPGTRFRYAGEGFVLLGRLVEAVTGLTAAQVVEARVIRPAGMRQSTYGWARSADPAVAWAHDSCGGLLANKGPVAYAATRDAGPAKAVDR